MKAELKLDIKSNVDAAQKSHPDFSPYTDNGGTVVAIAGKDYAIIGSETRLSVGYNIYTRAQPKMFPMTDKAVLGTTGCWCDALTFVKVIETRVKNYQYEHNRPISISACAQLISNMLYYKRFFPYYISNLLAGLDADGKGVVYSYDPVGHYEKLSFGAEGSSCALIQPFLDNRIGMKNLSNLSAGPLELPLEEAIKIVKDVFVSAAERDIYVGDSAEIRIITANGMQQISHPLRKD